ncbi:Protein mms22-like protein [Cladobotryum mycophilum]|uniref:Protein mms22-like protein n=1 Tax=Cladobotryum mycophilum TaxID=491253 RepID=A0ABR0S951_9HYPO
MATWKELGEVPDSEDEDGLDSQNLDNAQLQPAILATLTSHNDDGDIWDFPDSDEDNESRPRQSTTPDASLTSTPAVTPGVTSAALKRISSSPLSSVPTDNVADFQNLDRGSSTPRATPALEEAIYKPVPREDVSTSLSYLETPTPTRLNTGYRDLVQSPPTMGRPKASTQDIDSRHHTEEQEALQIAFRYERSLRPRKPIQEHPYLLENAQYSTFLREHGVKPVRVAVEPGRLRREETLQDDEFEQESQEALPEETDESQQRDIGNAFEERNDIFLSSSPPKTSPFINRAGASSLPGSQDTNGTSVVDQDLPDVDQLLNQPSRSLLTGLAKRKTSQSQSTIRKRKRQNIIHSDAPELNSPIGVDSGSPDPLALPFDPFDNSPTPTRGASARQSAAISPTRLLELPPKLRIPVINIPSEDEAEEQEEDAPPVDQETVETESESENEGIVERIGKRIRGVLPASWLRLDQLSSKDKAQKDIHKKQHRNLDRELKRGVAQPRQALPGSTSTQLLFEESEEEEKDAPSSRYMTTDDVFHNQTRLELEPLASTEPLQRLFSDDDDDEEEDLIVEEDHIDFMMPGRKRQLKLPDALGGSRKKIKKPNNPRNSQLPPRKPRQPQITSLFRNSQGSDSTRRPKIQKRSRNPAMAKQQKKSQGNRVGRSETRSSPPPHLSILDIIEPNAPIFLKVAARTAKRRDNIDAASILEQWRSGSIKQRPSVSTAAQSKKRSQRQPKPLSEGSGNRAAGPTSQRAPRNKSQKLVRHVSQGGSVSYRQTSSALTTPAKKQTASRDPRHTPSGPLGSARPAQLEVDETEQRDVLRFHSRKEFLDRLYRKRGQHITGTNHVRSLETGLTMQSRAGSPENEQLERLPDDSEQSGHRLKASRFRKQTRPRRVDVEAPQYTHADDPLPVQYSPLPEPGEKQPEGKKLQGLGPYGTRYTHHFEMFPLDSAVYFHESTLIGSGIIDACMSSDLHSKLQNLRPRVSFHLGEQMLRWGPWDDQTSSELGIVLDFVAEQLESSDRSDARSSDEAAALDAASFILKYVKDALSLADETAIMSFLTRLYKVLTGFCDRIDPHVQHPKYDLSLMVFDRLILLAFFALRICQNDSSLFKEQCQMEEILKSIARMTASILLGHGMNRLTETYKSLDRLSYRERGLRNDAVTIHSWTLLMKVLESSRIPRSSFWDILQVAMVLPQVISSVDVRDYERIWETMFTLLPLIEFNNCGILVPGKRHGSTMDGWTVPRKLLERVFQLYQGNDRQAPSFNNYCRALVGRCHYLLQQWGWNRSAPIIGVIFDFFGSQNLAHLRNEEVHKSPRFLEELARKPSLDIDPDDRCFHIFLKLLALSIRKLREFGSEKDIRNLVARTIPNHNRQYLKEQKVHERDLAALRNHHDLIGTLYWACPPKLRPSITLIERLITPESSHKEACLINIRAWNQLARFVVASGEATSLPRYFGPWRNSFFQKMIQQFDSVTSDIQQQLSNLSKDVSKSVSPDMVRALIALNKAAAVEVLNASALASLDVMRNAPDLEAASFCLILRAALATLDSFLHKVEEFKDNEESQQSESQLLNSAQADDALMVIDNDLSRSFFLMARAVLSSQDSPNLSAISALDRIWCVEEIVLLSARIGMRFINGGIMRLSDMFKSGKHGLFDNLPKSLDLGQRKYLALFISTLLKQDFDSFADAKFSLGEVWALSLVKPREYLEYENRLAEQLRLHGKEFVPDAAIGLSIRPDYNSNRDLFEFAISSMRKSVRDAGPSLKKILIKENSGILESVMAQIKGDLKAVSQQASQHHDFVIFTRDIISLIKVHGSEFCKVDDFFYKISKEYSPSKQDPQLQVAGMVSYGLRLQEGDTRVAYQLFYLLFTHFKFSLTSDKLEDDVDMLLKGMKHQGILSFALGKMLPAIIRASFTDASAFVLLDVYLEALRLRFEKKVAAYELNQSDLPHVAIILRAIMEGMDKVCQTGEPLSGSQVHVLRQSLALMNLLWPPLFILSASHSQTSNWNEVKVALESLATFTTAAQTYLLRLMEQANDSVEASLLFEELRIQTGTLNFDSHVNGFTKDIVDDIAKNWVVEASRIAIQAPGQVRSTQGKEQGVEKPVWNIEEMVEDLYNRVQEWHWWWSRFSGLRARLDAYDEPLYI